MKTRGLLVVGAAGALAFGCVFDLHELQKGSATGSGGAAGTSSGAVMSSGSTGGGGASPSVKRLGEAITDPLAPAILAAYGGVAWVTTASNDAIWRVPFDGSDPVRITPATDSLVKAMVADSAGLVWVGAHGTRPAAGTVASNGSVPVSQTHMTGSSGSFTAVVLTPGPLHAVLATGAMPPAELVRYDRACEGAGCVSEKMLDLTVLAQRPCFQTVAGHLFFQSLNKQISRIVLGPLAPPVDLFVPGKECAVLGAALVSNEPALAVHSCDAATLPCDPVDVGPAGLSLLTTDGSSLYAQRTADQKLVRFSGPSKELTELVPTPILATALAADEQAIYWLDASAQLFAIARP